MTKKMTDEERELEMKKCKKGRKVQILILLEKNTRLTSGELCDQSKIRSSNLASYTRRLEENGLIRIFDESDFKDPKESNYKYKYHAITEEGRILIADLHKNVPVPISYQ